MTPQMHPITGKNGYCGPVAMSTVLGISSDHAARIIRSVGSASIYKRGIRGVFEADLKLALEAAGCSISYRTMRVDPTAQVSAALWAQRNADLFASKHVIIVFGNHYGTLLGGRYQCSLTRQTVPLAEMPNPEKLVEACFFVDALPSAAPVDVVLLERKRNAQALARAVKLAQKHGIVIERLDDGAEYRVYSPELLHDDPYDYRSNPENAQEVLGLVEDYVDCLQNGYLEAVTDPSLFYLHQVEATCQTHA